MEFARVRKRERKKWDSFKLENRERESNEERRERRHEAW